MNKLKQVIVVTACTALLAACGSSSNGSKGPGADVDAPEVSAQSQSVFADTSNNLVMLDLSDNRTATAALALALSSSDQDVISDSNLSLVQSGDDWFISVTPESDVVGSSSVLISATDEAGNVGQTSITIDVVANQVSEIDVMDQLLVTGADEDPIAINGLQLSNDIDSEEWFDDLFGI